MKKVALILFFSVLMNYSGFIYSESLANPNWTGYFAGINLGYWWSQSDKISMDGSPTFINPTFQPGASNIANALAEVTNNSFSLHPHGFIGGGQAGYNYQYKKSFLFGFDLGLDGLSNTNNNQSKDKIVNLADFDENYVSTLAVKQKINYLGALRARLGYLYFSNLLIYATGGFAYGNVTLDTTWTAQESLGPAVFPTISTEDHITETIPGWTIGAGIEWLLQPNWSAVLEYSYYNLSDLTTSATLSQINSSTSPSAVWGAANAKTTASIAMGTFRAGINYHFSPKEI